MKYIILILTFLTTVQLFAEDTISYWVDSYYYEKEKIEIPSLQYKVVDWEPVFERDIRDAKKYPNTAISNGVSQKVDIDFLKLAKKIEINKDTTAYLLHIKAVDMNTIQMNLFMNIPENLVLEELTTDGKVRRKWTSYFEKPYKLLNNVHQGFVIPYGETIIRVLEIDKLKKNHFFKFSSFTCYTNHLKFQKKKLNNVDLLLDNGCGNEVTCMPDIENWVNQYKGVFKIIIDNIRVGDEKKIIHATGFVLNTADNYDMDKASKPYALTCYHFLKTALDAGYSIEEIFENDNTGGKIHMRIKFDFLRPTCGGEIRFTDEYVPYFTILEKGDWHSDDDLTEDYLFLQFGPETRFNIQGIIDSWSVNSYPGWRNDLKTNYDYSEFTPTYVFHHDVSDDYRCEMKYAKDNDYPVIEGGGELIRINVDEGFSTEGASGSPIFAGDHNVVGMLLTGRNTCENPKLQITSGISFSYLWDKANLKNYLGDVEKVYAINTTWSNLPDHCDNCEYDTELGETGLDCGGPCKPCKVFSGDDIEVNTFKSTDLPNAVQANNISMIGSSVNPIKIHKNLILDFKNSLALQQNINIDKSTEIKTGRITITVEREKDALCGWECPNYLYWGQTLKVNMKNITKFEFIIGRSDGVDVYEGSSDIYSDGIFDIWDSNNGENVNRNQSYVLFYVFKLWDTIGTYYLKRGNIHMFPV